MKLFALDFQSFSTVENDGFKEFVATLNPEYQLPTKYTISKCLLPSLYEQCMQSSRNVHKTGKKCCLAIEQWTSISTINYISVVAQFFDESFKLNYLLLDCIAFKKHRTSEDLAGDIKRILNDWQIMENDVIFAVSNNDLNIKNSVQEILKWNYFECFAYSINSIVNGALNNHSIKAIISKIKGTINYFLNNCTSSNKLTVYQRNLRNEPLKLLLGKQFNWKSTLYMLQRFLELQDSIDAILASIEEKIRKLTFTEGIVTHELCQILKPFENVVKSIDNSYCPASLVIPLINGLNNVCTNLAKKKFTRSVQNVMAQLKCGLEEKFSNIEENEPLAVATFLDPRFKAMAFSNPTTSENVKNFIRADLIKKITNETKIKTENDNEDELSIWNSFDMVVKQQGTTSSRAIKELQRYLEEDLISRNDDPLKWWQNRKYIYPHLAKIAEDKLFILASSVPCQWLFTNEGQILMERRKHLNDDHVEMLLFLKYNIHLMDE